VRWLDLPSSREGTLRRHGICSCATFARSQNLSTSAARRHTSTIAVVACVCRVAPAEAQLNTQHIKGTVGLKSGSQKLTDDQIEGFPDILIRGKNKVFAVGPEVQLALARNNTLYGR